MMTDNLRDHITAAIKAANDRVAGFIGYDEMADAVIAELNLSIAVEYPSLDGKRHNFMLAGHYTIEVPR